MRKFGTRLTTGARDALGARPPFPRDTAALRRGARRVGVTVVGGGLLAAGAVMLILPGPGLLVIPAALGVLGLEYEAPRRVRDALLARVRRGSGRGAGAAASEPGPEGRREPGAG